MHGEVLAVALDARDLLALVEPGTGGERPVEQAAMVAHRVERAALGEQDAAMERVGADLVAQLGLGHHMRLDAQLAPLQLGLVHGGRQLVGLVRAKQVAGRLEAAVDRLAADDVPEVVVGLQALALQAAGLVRAMAGRELLEGGMEAAADLAAIAGAAAMAGALGLQDHHAPAGAREVEGGRDPGETAADHRDVDPGGWRAEGGAGGAVLAIPPIGSIGAAGCQDVVSHVSCHRLGI